MTLRLDIWSVFKYCVVVIVISFHVQPAKKKQRAQVIEFFIDVARECFNIGNFNSLMAIICESYCSMSKIDYLLSLRLLWAIYTVWFLKSMSSCSWYEHDSCVTPEEDLGQSQDCQILHSGSKYNLTTCRHVHLSRVSPEADSMFPIDTCFDSIRWILRETFTITELPWGGLPIAPGLPTATEKG